MASINDHRMIEAIFVSSNDLFVQSLKVHLGIPF